MSVRFYLFLFLFDMDCTVNVLHDNVLQKSIPQGN